MKRSRHCIKPLLRKGILLILLVILQNMSSSDGMAEKLQLEKDLEAASSRSHESSTRHVAVAIIGSGFAGLAAAIEASNRLGANNGKILVIEKKAVPGGNSIQNAGQIAVVGSEAQKRAGIEDSVDLMMKDMLKAGGEYLRERFLLMLID